MTPSRRNLPPLNALRAFEVSGRRLNFRAAAEELGVTQGAVAQQVRALEEHLGVALFNRLSRGLSLTPWGMAYLVDVSRAFDTLAQATGQLQKRSEVVTISVTPGPCQAARRPGVAAAVSPGAGGGGQPASGPGHGPAAGDGAVAQSAFAA